MSLMQILEYINKDNVKYYIQRFRPHLDYGDVLYNQAFNNSFKGKMESIQYNACLALTGTKKENVKRTNLSRTGIGVHSGSTLD